MNGIALERVAPESVGISSRALMDMVRQLERCGTEMHGIMVARHGKVILEGWWAPYTPQTIHICHSFGKSYVATAVGAACTDGLLSIEDRVADLFAEDMRRLGVADAGKLSRLKVKHVLSMTNGMRRCPLAGEKLVDNYLTTPIEDEPGSVFLYNTAGSCMLGEMVRRATGESVYDYMVRRVLRPMGFDLEHFRWMTFPGGLHAAPGVASCTENNLRLGMLYLNRGAWQGTQLIDPEWIDRATRRQADNGAWGYGYQLWLNSVPGTYRFSGGHGQDCLMSPDRDMVVAIHQAGSEPHDTDAVTAIVNRALLEKPLPETLPPDPEGAQALAEHMRTRKIPPAGGRAAHAFANGWEGRYRTVEGRFHLQPELRPAGEMNVNADFYTLGDPDVHTMAIERTEEGFCLTMNDSLRIQARLDGKWRPHTAQSAMPAYDQSCAVARADENELIVEQWFYQTCFKTRLRMIRDGDLLHIEARKERLHDDRPYFTLRAVMKRT